MWTMPIWISSGDFKVSFRWDLEEEVALLMCLGRHFQAKGAVSELGHCPLGDQETFRW